MRVSEVASLLSLNTICVPDPDREVLGGYTGDLLSWVMGRAKPDDAWITIMSNQNIAAVAMLTDVSMVILAENVAPDAGVQELCEAKSINLFSSELPAYELCVKLEKLI